MATHNNQKSLKIKVGSLFNDIDAALRHIAETGSKGIDASNESIEIINDWGKRPKVTRAKKTDTLEGIRKDLGDCKRCRLSETRKHIVFGAGDPRARLVFVGEGPGFDEDQQGEPFVGAAGQLLTKIIQAINFTREIVYICNVIKCRPPDNRNPMPDEIKMCRPFLERQLSVIKPHIICALGSFAAKTLLDSDMPISRLRGRFHDYHGIKLMPTYHPAYLLRNPDKKKDVWEDMKKIMAEYGN